MLIEFSVENYRSIKNKITFSMVASRYYKNLSNNLYHTKILKKDNLLRSSLIYGPNASGKTNVIHALYVIKNLVIESHNFQKGTKLYYKPFKLDAQFIGKPTKFEVIFIYNNIKYKYCISYVEEKIIEEKLYYYPKNKMSIIFERIDTDKFYFTQDKINQMFIAKRTLDNVLYLSNSTKEKYQKTTEAFNWFKDILFTIGPADHPWLMDYTASLIQKDEKLKKIIMRALEEADFGIINILSESKKRTLDDKDLPKPLKEAFKILTKEIEKMSHTKLTDGFDVTSINTYHRGKDNKVIKFDFEDEESEGTKRIFSLIGAWVDSLLNGRIIIADELDTKLHYLLQIFLIGLFNDPTQNKKNAQLIFTTHNINLLDQNLFRRDQIWFTEKDFENGDTKLFSLSDFRERNDKDILKAYRSGRYGAIPFIKTYKVFS